MDLSGTVKSVRIDQEKHGMVLRVVVESEDGLLPIQMRGRSIDGILEPGDQVALRKADKRGRDGVIRPKEINNQTTNSIVRVTRRRLIARFSSFVLSIVVSVGTTVGSKVLVDVILNMSGAKSTAPALRSYPAPHSGGATAHMTNNDAVGWIIGVVVGVIVFYLIYLRRRR